MTSKGRVVIRVGALVLALAMADPGRAVAAPAPPCNVPPTQCSPDGKIRIGFDTLMPAQVVDIWVPSEVCSPNPSQAKCLVFAEYSQIIGASGAFRGFDGGLDYELVEAAPPGGLSHFQAVAEGDESIFPTFLKPRFVSVMERPPKMGIGPFM